MSAVETRQVAADDDGMRLDRWFRQYYPTLGHGQLQKMLRKGQVRVDGSRAKANARVIEGQTIRVPPMPEAVEKAAKENQEMHQADIDFIQGLVIYKDDDLIALNKPPGLAVQGGTKTTRHIDGMLEGLREDGGDRPRLVHRLDRDTSGVLILARSRTSAAYLGKVLKDREAEKVYWALASGVPKMQQGKIDLPLIKSGGPNEERMRPAEKSEKDAKWAITYYKVMDQAGQKLCWLAMLPITGRTHQLRVHAQAIGHPIIGDGKYGGEEAFLEGEISNKLHLHARSMTIPRKRGGPLTIEAPLPDHMARTWALFGFDVDNAEQITHPSK